MLSLRFIRFYPMVSGTFGLCFWYACFVVHAREGCATFLWWVWCCDCYQFCRKIDYYLLKFNFVCLFLYLPLLPPTSSLLSRSRTIDSQTVYVYPSFFLHWQVAVAGLTTPDLTTVGVSSHERASCNVKWSINVTIGLLTIHTHDRKRGNHALYTS